MWYFTIAQLFSSLVKEFDFVSTYRITLGFVYINPIDALVYFSVIIAVVFSNNLNAAPKNRTHPMMFVIIILLLIGGLFGWLGAIVNRTPAELILRQARDHFAWPACIFSGYRLLPNSRSAWRYMYVLGLTGVFTSTMTIINFSNGTENYASHNQFNELRTVQYLIAYAGLGAAMFTYSIISRPVKMLPTVLAVILACYCLIGQFAPLSRGEWIEGITCVIGLASLLPAGKRVSALLKGLTMISILLCTLYGAVQVVSAVVHRDFAQTVNDRIMSLVPGSESKGGHAWDSRTGSISQELGLWAKNPIFGEGFEAQIEEVSEGKMDNTMAYFHNGWSSQLATTGIFGFAGFMCIIGAFFVVGRRLVQSQWDRGTVMMGAYCFAASIYLMILTLSSMIWFSRGALLFGALCGMMLRLRDIQLTAAQSASVTEEHDATEFESEPADILMPASDTFF